MSKDTKIVLALGILELILISILLIVSAPDTKTVFFNNSFAGSDKAILHSISDDSSFVESMFTVSDGNHIPVYESDSELYNYYVFTFTEEGVSSNKITALDGLSMDGFVTELSDSDLTVPKKKYEYHLGNLCVINDYVPNPIDLTSIVETPLKLKKIKSGSDSASVVIYYTHTSEAYCKTVEDKYDLEGYSVSSDNENNVVASGTAIQNKLTEAGIKVINDTTVHDSGSNDSIKYSLSASTLTSLLEANPDVVLAIDVHRDGVDPYKGAKWGPTCEDEDGNVYSKIMFVVGMDYEDKTYRQGTDVNPYWKENFKLCLLLIEKLEERVPGITRGISFRRNPYNQQYVTNSLLCEVGFNGNLTSEATNTASLLGEILAEIYS